jgi:hypothetical protein
VIPKLYKVTEDFAYFDDLDCIIRKGEIIGTYYEANPRVHGGIWSGFVRHSEHYPPITKTGWFINTYRDKHDYNAKYIRLSCVEEVEWGKIYDLRSYYYNQF